MERPEDIASEEWDAKVKPIIEKALAEFRIPTECIKYVDITEDYRIKTVQFIEC